MSEGPGQCEWVDLRDTRDDDLLNAFYRELYLPAFPIVSEQEDPEVWAPRLWGPAGRLELHILLAGSQLADPERRILAGGVAFELYHESRCGLLTYLVVAPSARQRGLGWLLVTHALQRLKTRATETGAPLRAVFGETNNPALVAPEQDSMDPRRRLEILTRLGAQIVEIRYIQPELIQGQGRGYEMLLIAFPLDGTRPDTIDAACVRAFLEDFYRTNGLVEPSRDREFQQMIASMPGATIPLTRYPAGRQ
jgi:GNAT superfamily N-acetyltransferase